MTSVANAAFVTIDFNGLSSGTTLTNQYSAFGVDFALLDIPSQYQSGPGVVFINNSTYAPASGMAITPGDNTRDPFYDIELSFTSYIDYFSILALDADEPVYVRGYGKNNILMQEKYYSPGSDTQVWKLELGGMGGSLFFDRIVIDVVKGNDDGSGYAGGPEFFDNLNFNTVPEPATMLLFGVGLIGLSGICRKRR